MNILLLAFALPVATILLAIVLQKILKCPLLVAATFFAILLIVTYAAFDSSFLVFAIIYTILAYVTAVLTKLICCIIKRLNLDEDCICTNNSNSNDNLSRTRNSNCNVSTGTWSCTANNLARTEINPVTANALINNGRICTCSSTQNGEDDPVIILTNANNITNNGRTRNGRNCCNCRR